MHPFVLALVFPGFGWVTAAGAYRYLVVAAAVVLAVPGYPRRPVAAALTPPAVTSGPDHSSTG